MALKIKVKEASPRKFRAKPSDRGVGGKWGPASNPDIRPMRNQSAQQWRDNGLQDDLFLEQLQKAIDSANLPWEVQGEYCKEDAAYLVAHSKDYWSGPIQWDTTSPFYKRGITPTTIPERGIERLFYKICRELHDEYGVFLKVWPSKEGHDDELDARLEFDSHVNATRKDVVDLFVNAMKDVDAYLKKKAPAINREASRTFSESKTSKVCSMQKKIESLKKNKR